MSTIWINVKEIEPSPILASDANEETMLAIQEELLTKEFLIVKGDSMILVVRCSEVLSVVLNKDG